MPRPCHVLTAGVLLALGSCNPTENPPASDDLITATGRVVLPAGYTPAADLKVIECYGAGEITMDSNGAFAALVPTTGFLQVDLVNTDGKLLMMGQISAAGGEISPKQTAVVLAFYAVGGFTLPPEHHDALMDLLADEPVVDTLAAAVEARLVASPLALADGDDDLNAAVRTARNALLPTITAEVVPTPPLGTVAARTSRTLDGWGALMTVQPSAAQSGIELLQDSAGPGVIAQNSFRRYATYLAYQTATEDANGVKTTHTAPLLVGAAHDVPSTSRLEFFSAISDVVTGHAPFEPVRSSAVELPLVTGSVRTYYDIVMLGPAIEPVYPPIFQETRYFPMTAEWDNQIDRLRFKMFWLDFAWPAIETFLFVRGAGAQQAKLDEFVAEFKGLCDRRLAGIGVALKSRDVREGGLAVAMNLLLNALKEDTFRLEFVTACKKAMAQSALNQANFEAMSQKLAGRAAAASIAAAIQIALTVGDLSAVVHDLLTSRSGELWTVTVVAPPVRLEPNPATVKLNAPSVSLTATVQGTTDTTFVFRWTTTGAYGKLSDVASQQGTSFVSTRNTVLYLANVGAIKNGNMDTVTVEVYQDDGSGTIGADSVYLGRATAQIKGVRDDEEGPVWIDAYPSTQPSYYDPALLTAHLEVEGAGNGAYSLRWTTSGDHGRLDGNRTEIEGVDVWDVFYWANENEVDGALDSVVVEITRVADGTPMGDAEITMDIWNPTTVYGICGDAAGQDYPDLGSGTSWTFYIVDHGPWMGANFYARAGAQIHARLDCSYGPCAHDLGPVYVRRGAVGDPPDITQLIAAQGHYACTPPEDGACTMVDVTITLP